MAASRDYSIRSVNGKKIIPSSETFDEEKLNLLPAPVNLASLLNDDEWVGKCTKCGEVRKGNPANFPRCSCG